MLFAKDSFHKKNNGKYMIGYEFALDHVQISFMMVGEEEPQTLSLVAGMEQYNIPFVLYKKEESDLWFIGKEAIANQESYGGLLLSDLLRHACEEELSEVYLESYDSCALLALFVKRSLSYLSLIAPIEQIAAIMFAVDELNERMVMVLRKMVEFLQLPHIKCQFIAKEECFFFYNLHTDAALWANPVMLYELQNSSLCSYKLSLNRQTTPIVTLVEKKEYPDFPGKEPVTVEEKQDWDNRFLEYLQEDMENKIYSSVYLIGDGFLGEWYQKSVRFLCAKRRVFRGNNLFSKGACLALWDKLEPKELSKNYVYLGNDKLMANVGMNLFIQGQPSYLAVLDGGNSWYDCKKEWDMILENDNQLTFRMIPLNGKNETQVKMVLHGFQKNRHPYARVHVEVCMESKDIMKVKVWDRGFGEFYPSSERCWEERVEL